MNTDKTLLSKLIFFSGMIVVGLLIWLVVNNLLIKPTSTEETNEFIAKHSRLLRPAIDPTLETSPISAIMSRRSFEWGALDAFEIYLLDDSQSSSLSQDLIVQKMTPSVPLDLGYTSDDPYGVIATTSAFIIDESDDEVIMSTPQYVGY